MPIATPDRTGRRSDAVTAAGLSVIVTGIVGAAVAADHAIRRDPGRPWTPRGRRNAATPASAAPASGASDAPSRAQQHGTAPAADDASKPEGPEDLHKRTWVYALKKTGKEFGADQCTDLAAALVYYSVLALGPGILAIVSILGLLDPKTITDLTKHVLGPALGTGSSAYSIVNGLITNASAAPAAGFGLVIGILGALWSASGYVGAFGRAMNRIYSIPEGRPIWKLRPTQLLVTLTVVILVVIAALLLVSTGPVVQQIASIIGIGDAAFLVFSIVKWPILVVIAIAAIAILYYFSPNVRQPKFKWISTGSLLALVVWALATVGLGLYIGQTGGSSYSRSYGPIAGVIIFLLWLWITNLVLLFGAEFDAELERSRELQAGIAAEEQIQLPLRDTRQSDKKAAKHQQDVDQARALRISRGRND